MESIISILPAVPDHHKANHLVYPLDYILRVSFTALMSGYITLSFKCVTPVPIGKRALAR